MNRIRQLELSGHIDFTRQRDWFDATTMEAKLTIIGCGGVGSMFSILAGKLGVSKLIVYDHDLVEAHNLPNQFFELDRLGFSKVDSIKSAVEAFTISEVEPRFTRVESSTNLSGLVVSGVDSMSARKEIAEAIHRSRMRVPHYWDARIGGEKIVIYSVNPRDPKQWELYKKSLYSDESAQEDPCTRRSVIDVMGHVSSYLLTGVREYLAGKEPVGFLYHNIEDKQIYSGDLSIGVA